MPAVSVECPARFCGHVVSRLDVNEPVACEETQSPEF